MENYSIHCLPDEVIFMVLHHNDINEIINFGSTCKRFNSLTNNNQSLWKDIFKKTLPVIFKLVEKRSTSLWLNELKDFMKLKQLIYGELITMSPKHYWKIYGITMQDASYFFTIASSSSHSYYYTIYILQDIIIKGNKIINHRYSKKPFTLTELQYAKTVLRYLIHCYLAVKWVKGQISYEIPPEVVINYFLQWIDTVNFHFNEDIEDKLQDMATEVNIYLEQTHMEANNGRFNARQIFSAISQVLFHRRQMEVTISANLDTLDIIKVLDNQYGNQIVVFAIFQAVAKRCGAVCELIVFSNYLFLEWRSDENDPDAEVFTINIANGELELKRSCPFAQSNQNARYRYSADSLLQCLHSSFVKTMGVKKSWTSQNASDLLGFLGGNYSTPCPYDHFYEYLFRHVDLTSLNTDLNIQYLTEKELETILSLVQLNANASTTTKAVKILEVKKHHSSVLYAVGMICCHKEHGYVCIVRGWDLSCGPDRRGRIPTGDLQFGHYQPFYHVLAGDESDRYVAQENLIACTQPSRMSHLEELVAKEFCHFDGFSYVLNDEKKMEYPDEDKIVEVFRQRSHIM